VQPKFLNGGKTRKIDEEEEGGPKMRGGEKGKKK